MKHAPIVLVLGAGASQPYGFPLGPDLAANITDSLSSKSRTALPALLKKCGFDSSKVDHFRTALVGLGANTIDEFLRTHPDLRDIGRHAIAALLIPYENANKLLDPKRARTGEDWYLHLFHRLRQNHVCGGSKVTVLTLNYDRSFEQTIYRRIVDGLNKSHQEAEAKFYDWIYPLHLHGQLGHLPWTPSAYEGARRDYAHTRTAEGVQSCAEQLLVVGDTQLDRDVAFDDARSAIDAASVVCFLGCGYDDNTLRRLDIAEYAKERRVVGTAYGITDERERQRIAAAIPRITLGASDQSIVRFLESNGVLDPPKPRQSRRQAPFVPLPTRSGSWMA